MKITALKCALMGKNLVLRVVTDKGIDGYSQIENNMEFLRPLVPYFEKMILGCDPTDVERVMIRMRRAGAFKPWGKIVSSIEMALWDIAGKEAGLPVYKLLGGKVRDRVRVYNGSFIDPNPPHKTADTPEKRGENILHLNELPEGFTMVKTAAFWHSPDFFSSAGFGDDDYAYNTYPDLPGARLDKGSLLTERGLNACIDYIARIKKVVGDKVGLAFDVGPGFAATDAMRLAKAVEPYNVLWLEDLVSGDYSPSPRAHVFRDITANTTTPIHTGEQIFLRQNYVDLIESHAVNVVGPDPADVGGIAELKWIAEYADLHGIHMAPHGTFDGVFGMAALTHVCATMPNNYVAYEYPFGNPEWWYDIVDGLPANFLRDGHVTVWDAPGVGVTFNVNKAEKHLSAEDKDFFLG